MNKDIRFIKKLYIEPLINNLKIYFKWFFK